MEDSDREALIADVVERVGDLARGFIETAPYEEGFYIGVVGIAFEVHFEDGDSGVGSSCSDDRNWVRAGLFRRAMLQAEVDIGRYEDDDDSSSD